METRPVRHPSILDLPEDERKKAEARFWSKVEKTEGCWNWKFTRTNKGYGELGINGDSIFAHRIAYELVKGRIADRLELDHLCRNPACVNPSHLEAVTMRENILRGIGVTAINARKTHCPKSHPYTQYGSIRICKQCRREYNLDSYRRKALSEGREYRVRGPYKRKE